MAERFIVVCGNASSFPDEALELPQLENDMAAVSTAFGAAGFTVVDARSKSLSQIKARIIKQVRKQAELLVLYVTSHGNVDEAGRSYVLLHSVNNKYEVYLNELADVMEVAEPKRRMIIVDACNSASDGVPKHGKPGAAEVARKFGQHTGVKDDASASNTSTRPSNLAIFSACLKSQTALTNDASDAVSHFTQWLVSGVGDPSVCDVFDLVKFIRAKAVKAAQSPVFSCYGLVYDDGWSWKKAVTG
jgi:hypothetical protein